MPIDQQYLIGRSQDGYNGKEKASGNDYIYIDSFDINIDDLNATQYLEVGKSLAEWKIVSIVAAVSNLGSGDATLELEGTVDDGGSNDWEAYADNEFGDGSNSTTINSDGPYRYTISNYADARVRLKLSNNTMTGGTIRVKVLAKK